LRGALVIYDPADPQKYLYDVDDGETDAQENLLILADIFY
jgi:hypothetical protein